MVDMLYIVLVNYLCNSCMVLKYTLSLSLLLHEIESLFIQITMKHLSIAASCVPRRACFLFLFMRARFKVGIVSGDQENSEIDPMQIQSIILNIFKYIAYSKQTHTS